jgi:hypothetical protein
MKNQNGVVIELKSTTQGASLKPAAEGLKLSVVKEPTPGLGAALEPPPRRTRDISGRGRRA